MKFFLRFTRFTAKKNVQKLYKKYADNSGTVFNIKNNSNRRRNKKRKNIIWNITFFY